MSSLHDLSTLPLLFPAIEPPASSSSNNDAVLSASGSSLLLPDQHFTRLPLKDYEDFEKDPSSHQLSKLLLGSSPDPSSSSSSNGLETTQKEDSDGSDDAAKEQSASLPESSSSVPPLSPFRPSHHDSNRLLIAVTIDETRTSSPFSGNESERSCDASETTTEDKENKPTLSPSSSPLFRPAPLVPSTPSSPGRFVVTGADSQSEDFDRYLSDDPENDTDLFSDYSTSTPFSTTSSRATSSSRNPLRANTGHHQHHYSDSQVEGDCDETDSAFESAADSSSSIPVFGSSPSSSLLGSFLTSSSSSSLLGSSLRVSSNNLLSLSSSPVSSLRVPLLPAIETRATEFRVRLVKEVVRQIYQTRTKTPKERGSIIRELIFDLQTEIDKSALEKLYGSPSYADRQVLYHQLHHRDTANTTISFRRKLPTKDPLSTPKETETKKKDNKAPPLDTIELQQPQIEPVTERYYEWIAEFFGQKPQILRSLDSVFSILWTNSHFPSLYCCLVYRSIFDEKEDAETIKKHNLFFTGANRAFTADWETSSYTFEPIYRHLVNGFFLNKDRWDFERTSDSTLDTVFRLIAKFFFHYFDGGHLSDFLMHIQELLAYRQTAYQQHQNSIKLQTLDYDDVIFQNDVPELSGSTLCTSSSVLDLFVETVIRSMNNLRNEDVLIRYLFGLQILSKTVLYSKTQALLFTTLQTYCNPGGPHYPPRSVRQAARSTLDVCFPRGMVVRTLVRIFFRMLHPIQFIQSIFHYLYTLLLYFVLLVKRPKTPSDPAPTTTPSPSPTPTLDPRSSSS